MSRTSGSAQFRQLCQLLVASRQAAGLTQAALAALLDRPQSFVSKYETGERRLDVIEFVAVANALGGDPAALLTRLLHPPESADAL
ncbi:MAG: helix-turn-helix domain-containing protein [Fimbriimonadaceae bacterium]|nr:helix-turn-helix domain-containing protein [Fimbriimonadaceae bacterium]